MRGGAWVDLYHITFGAAEYITICVSKLYHIGKADISLIMHCGLTPFADLSKIFFCSSITMKNAENLIFLRAFGAFRFCYFFAERYEKTLKNEYKSCQKSCQKSAEKGIEFFDVGFLEATIKMRIYFEGNSYVGMDDIQRLALI